MKTFWGDIFLTKAVLMIVLTHATWWVAAAHCVGWWQNVVTWPVGDLRTIFLTSGRSWNNTVGIKNDLQRPVWGGGVEKKEKLCTIIQLYFHIFSCNAGNQMKLIETKLKLDRDDSHNM